MIRTSSHSNVAYIDGANLHTCVKAQGWKLDYKKFRVWLKEKYSVKTAYIFLGLIPRYSDLYNELQNIGYSLIFKDVVYSKGGKPKGNCDADLVLQAVRDVYESEYNEAILVSSDGDYSSLVRFLQEKRKMRSVLSPAKEKRCSILLKRTGVAIVYISDKRKQLHQVLNEKAPDADRTAQGSLS